MPPRRFAPAERSLACLIQSLEGRKLVVELRSDVIVRGLLDSSDDYMNMVLTDVTVQTLEGTKNTFDIMYLKGRNVRFVHLPKNLSPAEAIAAQKQKIIDARLEQLRERLRNPLGRLAKGVEAPGLQGQGPEAGASEQGGPRSGQRQQEQQQGEQGQQLERMHGASGREGRGGSGSSSWHQQKQQEQQAERSQGLGRAQHPEHQAQAGPGSGSGRQPQQEYGQELGQGAGLGSGEADRSQERAGGSGGSKSRAGHVPAAATQRAVGSGQAGDEEEESAEQVLRELEEEFDFDFGEDGVGSDFD